MTRCSKRGEAERYIRLGSNHLVRWAPAAGDLAQSAQWDHGSSSSCAFVKRQSNGLVTSILKAAHLVVHLVPQVADGSRQVQVACSTGEWRRSVKGSAAKLIHGAARVLHHCPGTMLCYSMGCLQHTREAHAAASEGLGRSQQQTCAAALRCCVLPPQTQANTGNTWIKQAVRNPSAPLTRVMPPTPRCLRICVDT